MARQIDLAGAVEAFRLTGVTEAEAAEALRRVVKAGTISFERLAAASNWSSARARPPLGTGRMFTPIDRPPLPSEMEEG